jgi:hypothetical protein
MKRLIASLLITGSILLAPAHAALGEKEVTFSEADIQTVVNKNGPLEKRYGPLFGVALNEPPKIRLGHIPGRAGISARVFVTLFGNPPVPVDVVGNAGIRYDDQAKAFFLDNPVAESVESVALPKESEANARQAVTRLIATYFRNKPVYVLREDGSPQEAAARWLLKQVRIEYGKVVATLSPF